MKPQSIPANGPAPVQQACQFLYAFVVLSGLTAAPILAQDFASTHASLAASRFALGVSAEPAGIHEDEFQTTLAPSDEVSSSHMLGKQSEALPCEEHTRANDSETMPSVSAPVQSATASPADSGDQPDYFLKDKIQTVQRMIRLMELKEEIMLEKARFEQELVDLQTKIENR